MAGVTKPDLSLKTPGNFVISAFRKNRANNTDVKIINLTDLSNTQENLRNIVTPAFKNCTNNTVVNRKYIIPDYSITRPNPCKVVISAFKKNCTNNTKANRHNVMTDPSITQAKPSKVAISCTNNAEVNIVTDSSVTRENLSNTVMSAFKNCTNNTKVNKRDVKTDLSNTRVNPNKLVISAFKKNCTNNTKVNRQDVLIDPSITRANPSKVGISTFNKNYTNNTEVNIVTDSSVTRENLSNAVMSAFKNSTNNTEMNKRDVMTDPSNTRVNSNKVAISDLNRRNSTDNIVGNLQSTAHFSLKDNNIQKVEHSGAAVNQDNCLRVWSGSSKDKGNISDTSSCSKVPNMKKYNLKTCRVCLKKGTIPIYRNKANEDLADTIMIIAGVKICSKDHYPKHLCQHCLELLLNAVLFRNTAQMSDKLLRNVSGTNWEPVKINNNRIPKDDLINDDLSNDKEEPNVLEKHILHHTELTDHIITKLMKKPAEPGLEPTKLNNMPKDVHFIKKNTGNGLKYLNHDITLQILMSLQTKTEPEKVTDIVMPSDSTIHNDTTVQEYRQNITKILLKPDRKLHAKTLNIVMPDHTKDMQDTLKEYINPQIPESSTNIKPEIAKLNNNKLPEDDYFGDTVMDNPDRELTILEKRNKKLETTKLICKECDLQYNSFKEYINHNIEKHENKKIQCTFCQKRYSVNYIERHVSYHERGPFMCDICGKSFVDLNNFKMHCKTHTTDLPFKCSLCVYRGRTKRSLRLHMRFHTGEKPHKCPQCPQRFVNSGNLQRHIYKHKGERPFKCVTCKRGFFMNSDLKKHLKFVHFGIGKNTCRYCGETFTSCKNLRKHERHVHKKPKLLPLYLKYDTMNQLENVTLKT